MIWPLIAIAAAQAVNQMQGDKLNSKIQKYTAETDVMVKNLNRQANNVLAAVQGTLNRYMQTKSNNAKLEQGGRDLQTLQTNLLRSYEEGTTGELDRRIGAAEEAGALVAQMGAAGVGGGTMDMISATMNLKEARVEELFQRAEKYKSTDYQQMAAQIYQNMVNGQDMIQTMDNVDQTPYRMPLILDSGVQTQAILNFAQSAVAAYGARPTGNNLNPSNGAAGTSTINYRPQVYRPELGGSQGFRVA